MILEENALYLVLQRESSQTGICTIPELGHPKKKISFPVHRPGEFISAEWIHFFHIFEIILFFQHFPHHFYTEKKNILIKKKILRPPDWPQSWPPGGQETNFFFRVALYNTELYNCTSGYTLHILGTSYLAIKKPQQATY